MKHKRKRYNEEFKKQAVKYIQEQTKSVADIAEDLDIPLSTVHGWLNKYRTFKDEPIASMDRIHELERQLKQKDHELSEAKEELEIAKRHCTSSADQGIRVPIHQRAQLHAFGEEDVQGSGYVTERLLQVDIG